MGTATYIYITLLVALVGLQQLLYRGGYRGGRSLATGTVSNKLSCPDSTSVAVLISGQCQRFTYKENTGPILTFSRRPRIATDPKCPQPQHQPLIEVYIALQCETLTQPWTGDTPDTPYIDAENLDIHDIQNHFTKRGANKVAVQILNKEDMQKAYDDASYHVTHYHGVANDKALDVTAMFNGYHLAESTWRSEFRKFYARHIVYHEALLSHAPQTYSGYVYLREDNYFYEPLDMDKVLLNKNKTASEPFFVVDSDCRQRFGAYSDKIYITNQAGADLLFGRSMAEFMEKMKRYILLGYYKSHLAGAGVWPRLTIQPESFVHDSFSHAEVEEMHLQRIDVRFVGRNHTRCIPDNYYNCHSEQGKAAAAQHGLVPCDSLKQVPN